jgi:hypothetical protein
MKGAAGGIGGRAEEEEDEMGEGMMYKDEK